MAEIRLEKLRKEFGKLVAVRDITMTFPSATVTCLLGPSGCGKTTLMRMIAGLETPTSGEVYFDQERVTDLSPTERNIGMVFQYPVVYRGMSVYRNIELPLLQDKSVNAAERKERIHSVIDTLDLGHAVDLDVSQLDNGTRQKVAVARAVARQPQIILFDEPITNVDVASRVQLKRALKRLVKQHSQTIIYVTHDQTEAMTLADEILLMKDGEIVQRGAPRQIYDNPNDRFGGWFLGNPGMNFIDIDVTGGGDSAALGAPLFARPVRAAGLNGGKRVAVGIRPEHILVSREPMRSAVPARIVHESIVVGGQHLLTLQVGDQRFKAKVVSDSSYTIDDTVWVEFPLGRITLFSPDGNRLETALAAPVG